MATPKPIVKVFTHEGHDISVPFTGDAYFNATAAAKPFGKEPKEWLRLDSTKEYLVQLVDFIHTGGNPTFDENQALIVKRGSLENGGGTWMHPKLGVMFARWLNAKFAFWCDLQIDAILRKPATPIPISPETVEHLRRAHQIANAKGINSAINRRLKLGEDDLDFSSYHTQVCTVLTDNNDTPKQITLRAKLAGAKSKDNHSGRQAMRFLEPDSAAAASFNDSLVVFGTETAVALQISKKQKEVFGDLIAIGIIPSELLAADLH